ncbi:MAG TPA: nitrous oxide reductase family maturation protein NosD [Gammaproteobacteria bacterium]|nr:nitrous oxide reductase family maturation protein NosD [Gammaproteobacteria bacterium]
MAQDRTVSPGAGTLQRAIEAAAPGDRLLLRDGVYAGTVSIDRPLELLGEAGSIIDGGGEGRVITVAAPDVVVRGVTVRNSGTSLATEDSGIFVTVDGDRALIEGNRLEHNLIGVYLKGPDSAVVRGNVIIGSTDPHVNDRGNGIQLWNTPGSVVEDNDIRYGRDGIFVTTSRNNVFRGNHLRDLRFAIHYMYTNDSEVSGNLSTGNHVGYAVMYSDHLKIFDNVSSSDRDRGLFFNYANNSDIRGNLVTGGAEKCVFIYNANINRFHGNTFEGCRIGIHFTAGSERNQVYNNAFVNNRTQVKYVGTRHIEWSLDGRGNYWSDNPAFDLDDDGIADQPYQPNDLVDQIIWRHPMAKLLLNSPAVQVLRWAQSEFPALHPGGVKDSAPLMQRPQTQVPSRG